MLFHTHIIFGILVFLFSRNFFPGVNEVGFLLLILFGSILPDIDEKHSKISQWSGIVGKMVAFLTSHRGIFHSLLLFCVLFVLISYSWGLFYAWGILLGYVGHLFMDGLTLQGVKIFYPFSSFKMKGPIRVGSFLEGILLLGLAVIIVVKLI